jgi:hypothetical protein
MTTKREFAAPILLRFYREKLDYRFMTAKI